MALPRKHRNESNNGLTEDHPDNGDGHVEEARKLNDEETRAWSAALGGAAIAAPILQDSLSLMRPYRSSIVPVSAIDKDWRVALGDGFFTCSQNEKEAVVVHECLHVVCNHFQRSERMEQDDWRTSNVAEDLEINQMIITISRLRMPPGTLIPEKLKAGREWMTGIDVPPHETMEKYYKLLGGGSDNHYGNGSGDNSSSGNGSNENSTDSDSGSDNGNAENDSDDSGAGSGSDDNQSNETNGGSGESENQGSGGSDSSESNEESNDSGSGGDQSSGDGSYSKDGNQPGGGQSSSSSGDDGDDSSEGGGPSNFSSFLDEDEDDSVGNDNSNRNRGNGQSHPQPCGGVPPEDISEEADNAGIPKAPVDKQIEAHISTVNAARKRSEALGNPGSGSLEDHFAFDLDRFAGDPPIDWRKNFRPVFQKAVSMQAYRKTAQSFRRINRRGSAFMKDVVFPGMVGYQIKVMMAIDTSASVTGYDDQLSLICKNAEEIMKAVMRNNKHGFSCFCVDTTIKPERIMTSIDDLDLTGGGGTDMAPAFEYVNGMKGRNRPDIFVLASDGEFDWDKCLPYWPNDMKVIIMITSPNQFVEGKPSTIPDWVMGKADVIDVSTRERA